MILLCGIPSEAPLQMVIQAAERKGIDHLVFNQRLSQEYELSLSIEDGMVGGTLRIDLSDWPLDSFSGTYLRLMDHNYLPESRTGSRGQALSDDARKSFLIHQALIDWTEITSDCRVMNKLSAMNTNSSKPYQCQLIHRAGMSYPRTLITNDPEEVMGFSRTYGRPIYKSMSSIRSKVRQLGDIKMSQLENVRSLPTQFQTLVPGTNVRVHVVGEEVFATEVISEAIDYRYAFEVGSQVELKPTSLPNHIKEICSFLSRSLELPLCGIDLKRTLEDEYYCFEVNPSPGFSYYQEGSGQDIASAIVDYLSINGRDLKNERDMNMEVFDAGDRELD